METNCTQGNWKAKQVDLHKSIKPFRIYSGTKIICELKSYDRYNEEANNEEKANAKLIAAAPEMLKALQETHYILREYVKTYKNTMKKANDLVENAIKKATK